MRHFWLPAELVQWPQKCCFFCIMWAYPKIVQLAPLEIPITKHFKNWADFISFLFHIMRIASRPPHPPVVKQRSPRGHPCPSGHNFSSTLFIGDLSFSVQFIAAQNPFTHCSTTLAQIVDQTGKWRLCPHSKITRDEAIPLLILCPFCAPLFYWGPKAGQQHEGAKDYHIASKFIRVFGMTK